MKDNNSEETSMKIIMYTALITAGIVIVLNIINLILL